MPLNISEKKLSLANLGGGAAIERFDDELQRVLDNIADPNTIETAPREVTLKVKIKPKERSYAKLDIVCSSKLATAEPYSTNAYIGADIKGRAEAYEHNPEQMRLQFEQRQQEQQEQSEESGNVTKLRKGDSTK